MEKFRTIRNNLLFLSLLLLIVGCDQTFEPLAENNQYHFSIYGYLGSAADTQWVRVGTAREAIDDVPDPAGITVTLENLHTGETVIMQDLLFCRKIF